MNIEDSGKIAQRFASDVMAIQRQVGFQQGKSVVSVQEICEHNGKLANYGLEALPTQDYLGLPPHELTQDELTELLP